MYAIGNIIYGIPLESPVELLEEAVECDDPGFLHYYSGSGDSIPAAFGVEIGGFDECQHHLFVRDLNFKPSAQQVAEYQSLWDQQPQEIKDELSKVAVEPEVFILWSTS